MNLCYLIGIILLTLGSFGIGPPRCDLWKLGWAFVIAGLTFTAYVVVGPR